MSDAKRAVLMPLSSTTASADRPDVKCKSLKAVRLVFALPESNEGTCPMYNYKEELAAAKKRDKSKQIGSTNERPTNGLDPFDDDDDDDVRRIAQEMEAKYGMGPPAKKKRKGRRDDYADIGMGYDESDSFIDNTDGYDEIIPQNVTTLHGGFYINCGALEFKTDDEASSEPSSSTSASSSEDEDDDATENPSRKRILESSESEGETETDKSKENDKQQQLQKKPKLHGISNGIPVEKKRKMLATEKIKQSKRERLAEEGRKKTVKELLQEKREESNVASSTTPVVLSDSSDKGDVMKENKKPTTCLDNVNDIINLVAKGTNNTIVDSERRDTDSISPSLPQVDTVPSTESETNNLDSGQRKEVAQLPENLPEHTLDLVNRIKEAARQNSENNLKLFSSNIDKLLLSLERKCKCLGKQSRSRIYQHLAFFLKCTKETLIRTAKNLVLVDDTSRMKELIVQLRAKVAQAMPTLLENYERESQKVVQRKFSKEGLEAAENENKQLRMPKRKFIWPEEVKRLLRDIVILRRRCFIIEGKTKEDLEIHMNNYLKSDVQCIWPDGWMSMTALLKMYNSFNTDKLNKTPPNAVKPANKQLPNVSKPISKEVKVGAVKNAAPTPSVVVSAGSKELQRLSSNSMLSITPVDPNKIESTKAMKPQKHDLVINKLDNDLTALPISLSSDSRFTITPAVTESGFKKTDEPKNSSVTETKVKYHEPPSIALTPPTTDYTIKPTKPPTDHKIENIIKHTKTDNAPENLSRPKQDQPIVIPDSVSISPVVSASKEEEEEDVSAENLCKNSDRLYPVPENLSKPKADILPRSDNLSKQKTDMQVQKPKSEQQCSKPKPENFSKPKEYKQKPPPKPLMESEVIVLDDTLDTSDNSPSSPVRLALPFPAAGQPKNDELIDFTASELRRKPGPKSKTKYYEASQIKPVKSALLVDTMKTKTVLTGDSFIDNMLQENIKETEKYYKNVQQNAPVAAKDAHVNVAAATTMSSNKPADGDDILKVMEDLKHLQQMASPVKMEPSSSAPTVSVIAYNKNHATKRTNSSSPPPPAKHEKHPAGGFGIGFQDAFQRQFLNDLSKGPGLSAQSTPTSSKNYASVHNAGVPHLDKYFTNANNNFTQPGATKFKSTYPPQPTGPFNLMDDMLASFMSEYAYPKTANHKPKSQQK